MKNGLAGILESGRAPGYAGVAKDPQSADVAVPRAFKQLEQTHHHSKICKDAGFKLSTIKKTWGI